MSILGVDTSNHNHSGGARIDFAAVKASGRAFVVLKASEGIGFKDPYLDSDRAAAHAAGLIVLLYHFARGNDPAAEAAWFLKCVGALQVGEGVVCDDEVVGVTPAWVKAWNDAIFVATTVKPLDYMNRSTQNSQDWSAVVADNDGEWLAQYDGNPAVIPTGGAWGSPAMKQYSDAGTVAGIVGAVDLDVFYGTADQLAKYGLQGGDVSTQIDMNAFLNNPAYYPNGAPGPSISQVLKNLDLAGADMHAWLRGSDPKLDTLTVLYNQNVALAAAVAALAQQVTALSQQIAAAPGMTCLGSPKAVLTAIGQAATSAASAP